MATNDTTARPTPAAAPAAPAASARAARAPRARARRARRAPRARRAARRSSTRRPARTTVGTTNEPVATTPIAQAQQLAERVVLIPIGAALEARDRVTGAVDSLVATTTSRSALDRQLKRFERRGGRARTELEREVRRTRSRIEREVRHGRVRVERQARDARRGFERVQPVRDRVENVVQSSVNAGRRLVGDAQDRIAKVV